ncbi:MAG: hypothetical protein RL701_3518 [Pseudomonadota bacterium]
MQCFCIGQRKIAGVLALVVLLVSTPHAHADSVVTFKYTPAPRAQVAIWIEDGQGRYLTTVALTEAVAFRGIGNRPGASNMNSGYRWPYGRREGVLPVWAHRRASAPGAKLFPRVIFQKRVEGLASRTSSDQSPDSYYCLQFDAMKSTRDQLDAVSCATAFSSDKGRYLTADDKALGYAEPFEETSGMGYRQPLPLGSVYPARMDVAFCTDTGCYDHTDVTRYAADARAVMPEIDAVTMATPPGDAPQRVLFRVPNTWPAGEYAAFIEVNLEGDYNGAWNDKTFPKPVSPKADWDIYSLDYGYPYRGQPSLVWKVVFHVGSAQGETVATAEPAGRSSWKYWAKGYGQLEPLSFAVGDPQAIANAAAHSGTERLRQDANGQRFSAVSMTAEVAMNPGLPDAGPPQPDGGTNGHDPTDDAGPSELPPVGSQNPVLVAADGSVGEIEHLMLERDPNPLRAHEQAHLRMQATHSAFPLHAYEVRVSEEPIQNESAFIRDGRQAKTIVDAAEGPTLLTLPIEIPEGTWIEGTIADLKAETHYYVGVRATDEFGHSGPITMAEITTTARQFTTVTPCFVASVAYGSPLAQEVGVLRRLRDRYLMPQLIGRAFVGTYYRVGAQAARWIEPQPRLRAALRSLLAPIVALARARSL